jgi:hypothetical protein
MNCVFCQSIIEWPDDGNFYCQSALCESMCVRIETTNKEINRILFDCEKDGVIYLVAYNYRSQELYVWYRKDPGTYRPFIHTKYSTFSITPFNIKDKVSLYWTFS